MKVRATYSGFLFGTAVAVAPTLAWPESPERPDTRGDRIDEEVIVIEKFLRSSGGWRDATAGAGARRRGVSDELDAGHGWHHRTVEFSDTSAVPRATGEKPQEEKDGYEGTSASRRTITVTGLLPPGTCFNLREGRCSLHRYRNAAPSSASTVRRSFTTVSACRNEVL